MNSEKTIEEELEELKEGVREDLQQDEESDFIRHLEIDEFSYPERRYYIGRTSRSTKDRLSNALSLSDPEMSVSEGNEIIANLDIAVQIWADEYDLNFERNAEAALQSDGIEYIKSIDYEIEDFEGAINIVNKDPDEMQYISARVDFEAEDSDFIDEYLALDAAIKSVNDRLSYTRLREHHVTEEENDN